MAKINVSIPDELLAEVDEIVREFERSRSGLVQEATAQYVARRREEKADEQRRADIEGAMAGMRELSKKVGSFDSTAFIRADRDSNYGHPVSDE